MLAFDSSPAAVDLVPVLVLAGEDVERSNGAYLDRMVAVREIEACQEGMGVRGALQLDVGFLLIGEEGL